MKLLIVTAWWPTKSGCFQQYSAATSELLQHLAREGIESQLFITTHYHESKFGSIVGALTQGQQWAIEKGFTHLLILEADKVLPPLSLKSLIASNATVILAGRGGGSGKSRYDVRTQDIGYGWGCTLIATELLKQYPLDSGAIRDHYTPDRAWFKRLMLDGVPILIDHEAPVETLEPAATAPQRAFKPKENIHV